MWTRYNEIVIVFSMNDKKSLTFHPDEMINIMEAACKLVIKEAPRYHMILQNLVKSSELFGNISLFFPILLYCVFAQLQAAIQYGTVLFYV